MATILIVEDNPDIALLYQRALMRHENCVVHSAEAAIETLDAQTFDLLILDMHLPEQSGLNVLEYVRASNTHQSLKVFVISADDLLRHTCEDIGIDSWMTKPIEIDLLMETVEKLLT
jgi:DNA-binding response OmpR family regulator